MEAWSEPRQRQRQRTAQLTWSRDPFTHATLSKRQEGMYLSGIFWDPKEPMALINDRVVHVGDEVQGYRVDHMTQDEVTLVDEAHTVRLRVGSTE